MCLIMYVCAFLMLMMHRLPGETLGFVHISHRVSRCHLYWTLLGWRALEDAMVHRFLGVSRHQRESGSSLVVEDLSRRIIEAELLMQPLQLWSALCVVAQISGGHTVGILLQL